MDLLRPGDGGGRGPRPAGPGGAAGADQHRRLPLRRADDRPPGRGRGDPGRTADGRHRRLAAVPATRAGRRPHGWIPWAGFTAETGPARVHQPVEFDHPLYILFSSGTTGKPKPIVHGHGGILLEHAKVLGLHFDLVAGDRFFWFTTTGWMMWNFCVSGLLVGSAVVALRRRPGLARPRRPVGVMASNRHDVRRGRGRLPGGRPEGGSAAGGRPRPERTVDPRAPRVRPSRPPPPEWVYDAVAADLLLGSLSGGTDVCTGFVGASPLHPVWAGEISAGASARPSRSSTTRADRVVAAKGSWC